MPGADGRSLGRGVVVRSRDYQIVSDGRLLHFLTYGAPLARFARESFAIIHSSKELVICQYVLLW